VSRTRVLILILFPSHSYPGYIVFWNASLAILPSNEARLFALSLNQLNGYVIVYSDYEGGWTLITSTKQVQMHQHVAHPPTNEHSSGLIDNISDTLLNAFSRVRKPDERFLAMRENVDKFEEGLIVADRLYGRIRGRTSGEYTRNALSSVSSEAE